MSVAPQTDFGGGSLPSQLPNEAPVFTGESRPEKIDKEEVRAQLIEIPQRTLPYWDVQQVRCALDQHEFGILQLSALLAEAMDRDDRIKAVLDTRVHGLLGLPLVFTPADNSKEAHRACDILKECWDDWFPEGDLATLQRWAVRMGVGVGECLWTTDEGIFHPRLKVWHPQFMYWRWDLHDWFGGWQLITMEGLVEPLPGTGKWILLQPGGIRQPWMTGLVRSIARPYLIRGYAYRDYAHWSEVHGGGIKKAMVPSQAPDKDKQLFFASLANLGSNSVVVLPQSEDGERKSKFDLTLLEAVANEGEGFLKLIEKTDDSIAVAALGQTLTTSIGGHASRAAAQVHERVEGRILKADATSLMNTIRRDAIRQWAAINFGDARLAPRFRLDTEVPEDGLKVAQQRLVTAQAITQFRDEGIRVDADKMMQQMAVPLLDDGVPSAPDRVIRSGGGGS